MVYNMVYYSLFHMWQMFGQSPFNNTLHQSLLIYQETHVVADELL